MFFFRKADQTRQQTIVFADIAGSTALYEKLGDHMAQTMIAHRIQQMTHRVRQEKGVLIKTIGDEILCRFDQAGDALRAIAHIMREWPQKEDGLKVRIGLHTGEVILKEGDVFGDTVNVAARIVNLAKAEQVLCTHEVLMASFYPSRLLQAIAVKGKSQPIAVHEILLDEKNPDLTLMFSEAAVSASNARFASAPRVTWGDQTFYLREGQALLLGRDSACDLSLSQKMVSRVHAKIEWRNGHVTLQDTSTNGTFYLPNEALAERLSRQETIELIQVSSEKPVLFVHQGVLSMTQSGVVSLGVPVQESLDSFSLIAVQV